MDTTIIVDYEWFNLESDKYTYFISSQSNQKDVTQRSYTVVITGTKNGTK